MDLSLFFIAVIVLGAIGLAAALMHRMISNIKMPAATAPAMTDFFFIVSLPRNMLKIKEIITDLRRTLNFL